MLARIAFAATRTFLLALRLTLAAIWVVLVLVISLVLRVVRRSPEERLRHLQAPVEGIKEIEGVLCPYCSAINDETLPVCFRCGAMLPEARRLQLGHGTPLLVGLGIIVFLIVLLVAFATL